eukprot:scaffold2565_cov384-Prasinococcus_capsulatus_cf.AAC.5
MGRGGGGAGRPGARGGGVRPARGTGGRTDASAPGEGLLGRGLCRGALPLLHVQVHSVKRTTTSPWHSLAGLACCWTGTLGLVQWLRSVGLPSHRVNMRSTLLQLARQSARLSSSRLTATTVAGAGAAQLLTRTKSRLRSATQLTSTAHTREPERLLRFPSVTPFQRCPEAHAKKGKLIDVEEDLEYIRDAYKTLPRLNQYLNDPTIPKSEKTKGILSILDELKCNEVTKSFFGAPRWVGLYPCGMTSCHGLVGLMCCGCL